MLQLNAGSLAEMGGIAHGFFGRAGGVSKGLYTSLNCGPGSGDERANVIENRHRVAKALAPGSKLFTLAQIHSSEAVTIHDAQETGFDITQSSAMSGRRQGDAMATAAPSIAIGILTADCAPILFADPQARVIGAAHAGWKGALSGVIDSALAAMERLGAERSRIRAAIGPCIGQKNYEVGPEFHARFVETEPAFARYFTRAARDNHWQFDLPGFVLSRLKAAGIASAESLAACTYANEADFFSFRRATHRGEKDYGRQISAIALV